MKYILPSAILFLFLISCNDTNTKEVKKDSSDTSYSLSNPTGKGLEKITTSTAIPTILMQSWENASDAEDAQLSGGGSELDMPYRDMLFSMTVP